MAASKEGLIDNINCKLTTGGLTDIQASQLAGAAQALCCSSFYAVPCEACLPNAALNKGRFVYVTSLDTYRYSNGTSWTSNFCSAIGNSLYTWGYNNVGQLGDGTTTSRPSPGAVAGGGVNWRTVKVGNAFSAAIKSDGTLWTWGYNGVGNLGDGTITSRRSPGTTAGGGNNWSTVSAGSCHGAAIKTDGTLWTWGGNGTGQLGEGTTTNRSSPGTTAGGGNNWCAVSAGCRFTAAIKTDGTLWTWGYNGVGHLGDGTTTARSSPGTTAGGGTNWCAVAFGGNFASALKADGTLWTWGCNSSGQLGEGTTTNRSSPGTTAGGGNNWCQVANGDCYASAIKTDGTLWTWGLNNVGQLGTGNTTNRSSPGTTAGGGTTWSKVAADPLSACRSMAAVKTDGTLWTWGANARGQLGTGNTTSRSSPGTVSGTLANWKEVSTGVGSTAGLTAEGGF